MRPSLPPFAVLCLTPALLLPTLTHLTPHPFYQTSSASCACAEDAEIKVLDQPKT